MMSLRRFVSVACALGLFSIAIPSQADTLPPAAQDCKGNPQPGGTADIGDDCSLHDSADTQGTCQPSTCTTTSLCTDGGSGACSSKISCVLCIAGNGDGGNKPSDAGGGTSLVSNNSASGCSTSRDETPDGAAFLVGFAMLAGLVMRLRKRSPGA